MPAAPAAASSPLPAADDPFIAARKAKEAAKLELGFKSAPSAPAEDRPARAGGRGGRGEGRGAGRGGRGEGRGGRGGRGGDRPAGGRGGSGLNVKIEDASAFPTLGK